VSTLNNLAARISTLLPRLRSEFADWAIHQTESGRWLAIRGNICIRAHNAAELRKRIRRHLAETARDLGGEQA
jgi:hypothetical protein